MTLNGAKRKNIVLLSMSKENNPKEKNHIVTLKDMPIVSQIIDVGDNLKNTKAHSRGFWDQNA